MLACWISDHLQLLMSNAVRILVLLVGSTVAVQTFCALYSQRVFTEYFCHFGPESGSKTYVALQVSCLCVYFSSMASSLNMSMHIGYSAKMHKWLSIIAYLIL